LQRFRICLPNMYAIPRPDLAPFAPVLLQGIRKCADNMDLYTAVYIDPMGRFHPKCRLDRNLTQVFVTHMYTRYTS
jgi:hypothetical protein